MLASLALHATNLRLISVTCNASGTFAAPIPDIDLAALRLQLDPRLIDGIRNGQAQKFEYTLELCWKCIKDYLRAQEGIDEASPKKVLKAYYLAGQLAEDAYLRLLSAIDDRNRLAHIYDEPTFNAILARIPSYSALLEQIYQALSTKSE